MTNRSLVIVFFVLCHTLSAEAQFHIGVKAGVNAAKIDGKSFNEAFKYSYLLGGFAEIGLNHTISINPEVIFSQTSTTTDKSYSNTIPGSGNKEQVKAKLNYLSVPLLINVKTISPLHIEAGPQFSILMNKDKVLVENGKSAFKQGDFSVVGGVSLHFSILRLTARYVVGLNNINDLPSRDKWKNQALQVSAGLAF